MANENESDRRGPTRPEDRRRYQRYETRLRARIRASHARAFDCEVRDYCSGGMLVALSRASDSAELSVGSKIKLLTELATPTGPRNVAFNGAVVWAREGYLGIEFTKRFASIARALQQHDVLVREKANPVQAEVSGGGKRYASKLRDVADSVLPDMFNELLAQTLEAVLDAADHVGSDSERQQVHGDIATLERLRKRDDLVKETFARALDGDVADKVDDNVNMRDDDDELALVDTDDFERWLEASRVATHLERRFGPRLTQLAARIGALHGGHASEGLAVPFEPKQFAEAVKAVAEQFDLGSVSRGILYERCIHVLGDNLDTFYTELNVALDSLGAPVAPVRNASNSGRGRPKPSPRPDAGADTNQSPTPGNGQAAGEAFRPVGFDAGFDVNALLQRQQVVRHNHARNMVETLGNVSDNEASMASWMQMLNKPLLAEASSDPAFFHNTNHPLRSIVDSLGHLQLFRSPSTSDASDTALRNKIDALLSPIAGGDVDAESLQSIASRMGELTDEQSEHYQRNVEHVVAASQGRERMRQARLAVQREINRRYMRGLVPEVMPELLDVGWRSVLELAFLKDGADAEYIAQLAVLDSVVAHLGGQAFDSASPNHTRDELLKVVNGQLESAAFDPFRRDAVETRLRDELHGRDNAVAMMEMPLLDDIVEPCAKDSCPDDIPDAAWQLAVRRCSLVRPGDRLRFERSGQVLRAAWIRDDHELFTLVDHRGIRACDITATELAAGVHRRTILTDRVDGRPLSGRAVDHLLEAMEDRLVQQASQDSLTGLINRRQFHDVLDAAIRSSEDGALVWIDIDQFKLINDIYGYSVGDDLLVKVAAQLKDRAGESVVAHLGADRFAVLMRGSGGAQAEQWGDALRRDFARMVFDWPGNSGSITVSVGVAVLKDIDGKANATQRAVESALSTAKKAGGDQVILYSVDDPDIARERESVKWVARVDDALVDGELRLRCQPIVPLRPSSGLTAHFEVLLGVADSTNEALPVAEFIEAAERYKRMRSVDRWVTKSVFDWIAQHRDSMPVLHGFAVNLSGQTASDPSFVDFVRKLFQSTSIDPDWISFEVTETAAVDSLSGTAGIIHELKQLGCKVALDDFGSGVASYSYLKELPVDWLKIDGVFVRNIVADQDDRAVVRSINEIGHFLGKQTIAEYVTDEDTMQVVRDIGVDFGQGFGIARPMLLSELASFATEQQQVRQQASGGLRLIKGQS